MTGSHPRDFQDWIRIQERSGVNLRGLAGTIRSSVEKVKEQVKEISGRQPSNPIELVHQTAVYTDVDGRARVRFVLDFPDVTKGTDGDPIEIASYELWGRDVSLSLLARTTNAVPGGAAPGLTIPGLAKTPSARAAEEADLRPWHLVDTSAESGFRTGNFHPGTMWEFKARALGVRTTEPGRFSATVTVEMDEDKVPPPQPTAPVLTVDRGTITATWDGQSVLGPMPADFKYAVLSHGTASSPTKEIARFGRTGGFKVVANVGYYDPQFFRLQAVDESENRSPWSEQAVGYTTPLVDKDVILSTIDAAVTHLKNIDAGVSILPDTILTEHLVVTEEMTAKLANFLHVRADMLEVNEIWADTAWLGVADAKLVRADMFEGKEFFGGTFTGSVFQTSVEEYDGVQLDDEGLFAWDANGNSIFELTSGGAVFAGTVRSGTGTSQATLTDNVLWGQSGVVFETGNGDVNQPLITAFNGDSPKGLLTGALYLASSFNGGIQADLWLQKTGDYWMGSLDSFLRKEGSSTTLRNQWGTARTEVWANPDALSLSYTNTTYRSVIEVGYNGVTLTGNQTTVYGNFTVSGAKNFAMDHPTRPGMQLLHGSTESPVSGIEYWGSGVVGASGEDVFELPGYFEALAKPEGRTVFVTGKGEVRDWSDVIDGKVTVYGNPGTEYSWLVKAERFGGDFEVERETPARSDTSRAFAVESSNALLDE